MNSIVLTTLNARYSHSAMGLRCLYANLHELQDETAILEFVINENLQNIAEKILQHHPKIIGISVYIWNARDVSELMHIIKKVSPQSYIVIGGPEAGYLPHRSNFDAADYVISGEGEVAFYELCHKLLHVTPPKARFIRAALPDLKAIALPYEYYNDHDVSNRHIYVEVSRGCPFLCEFCLSSIDEKVRHFDLQRVMEALEVLWQRGVRDFKFIDRTFNINMRYAHGVLDFFLSKAPPYFAHFEVIPDHFPPALKEKLMQFPQGSLQLEVGIQTLDETVAQRIERPLHVNKIEHNIAFLQKETTAHLHLDLIVGLPGESIEGFGRNLDRLCAMSSSEIQVGILKKLSGTTLSRHDETYGMIYSDIAPYDLLQNDRISFVQMQEMKRFARYWDLLYNSGNFTRTLPLLWPDGKVFETFRELASWLYAQSNSTWKISLDRLAQMLFEFALHVKGLAEYDLASAMTQDLLGVKGRKIPHYLKAYVMHPGSEQQLSGKHKRQSKRQ